MAKKRKPKNHNLLFEEKQFFYGLSNKKLQKAIKLEWWSTSRELNKLGLFSMNTFKYIVQRPKILMRSKTTFVNCNL